MKDQLSYLEDLQDTNTKDFYVSENRKADDYFKNVDSYFATELLKGTEVSLRGLPRSHGKYRYFIERKAEWKKAKLMLSIGNSEPEVLLDFDDSNQALDFWYPSIDGKKLLYGTSIDGNEQTTLYVYDVLKRTPIDTPIPFAGYTDQGDVCWTTNNSFIYPRMNGFGARGNKDSWLLGTKLYHHIIGADPHTDALVFGKNSPDTVMLVPTLSSDKSALYVASCEDELTHQIHHLRLDTGASSPIVSKEKAAFCIKAHAGKVYALTNYEADHYRLLMCDEADLELDFDLWDEVLPESDDILKDFWIHKSGAIFAHYSHNVSSRLNIYDAYGNQDGVVHLPKHSILQSVICEPSVQSIYYSVSSYTLPTTQYVLTSPLQDPELLWQRIRLDGDDEISVDQYFAESNDGTQIPFFSICKKDVVDASIPTIVYGYGGFNISIEPSYLSNMRPWVLAGGRIVVANLRGGSEFGEGWHKQGSMKYKQNTFNDCIAVAQALVEKHMCTPDTLGVMGGSNGGLLVAAVTLQRPDLFRAGAALVPLTDMLEFYKHQVAEFWVHEYGDPRIPEQKAWIEKWSPYHYPIDATVTYPSLYYETALHDARVHPFHAFKMVARLSQEVQTWKGPLLLRTMTDTGHQSSNLTKEESAKRSAEVYSYFARELGLR
jgi:prolyl oligopeptidase